MSRLTASYGRRDEIVRLVGAMLYEWATDDDAPKDALADA